MASSLLESSLFNIEKLDDTNLPFWKEKIYNVLVQKKQVKPIKLMGVKLEAMEKEDWEDLDELPRSPIILTLSKSFYFRRVMICGRRFAACTRKRVWSCSCIG